jgi:hypothetical protein
MKNFVSSILLFALVGCATDPVIKTVVQKVEVPIAMPCKAIIPVSPNYVFGTLSPNDNLYDKTRALVADRKLSLGFETELLAALRSCE